ncbi:hypothetical protein VTO42DRAFT_6725 [Malbranchea cinnamomea]
MSSHQSSLHEIESKALRAESNVSTAATQGKALEAAIEAAEHYMEALKIATSPKEKRKYDTKCKELITIAERIKQLKESRHRHGLATTPAASSSSNNGIPWSHSREPVSKRSLSNREQIILLENSKLNGAVFPPWSALPEPEQFEQHDSGELYSDSSELPLSIVQRQLFNGWKRPSELTASWVDSDDAKPCEPTMLPNEPMDLVQDVTTDCSVVASLCTGRSLDIPGFSKLFSLIQMYPRDETLNPVLSPSGKYIFRMYFNGCYRKVVIDDLLPSSRTSRFLYVIDRNNPTFVWPALVEKAYLKVRGGYDFPGSNSGTDVWVLTGWIPEQVFLHHDELSPDELWERIFVSFNSGDVLLTIGTGRLTEREERELGLISLHDYAILDLREVDGRRELLVKNPWAAGAVWKGKGQLGAEFADVDVSNPELQRSSLSPGTFWMDCDEVLQNFENLYLNWNPALFSTRQDIHFQWDLSTACLVPGCFAENPQFALTSKAGGTVWLLLGKHFKTGDYSKPGSELLDTPSETEPGFISIYVFDNGGRRVYLSDGALQRGPYVDSPNTLMRLNMPSNTTYTVVVAHQSLPQTKHSFTLSAFSNSALSVAEATAKFGHTKKIQAAWTVSTAGGNAESERYPSNPQFRLEVFERCDVSVLLESENTDLALHVKIFWSKGERVSTVRTRDIIADSGDYRRGVAHVQQDGMIPGSYILVCSTFAPGQLGRFTLNVSTTKPCALKPLPAEGAGQLSIRSAAGVFSPGIDRILAHLTVPRLTRLRLVGRRKGSFIGTRAVAPSPVLMTIELGRGPYKEILAASGDGDFSDAVTGVRIEQVDLQPGLEHRGGVWLVLERIGGPGAQVQDFVEVEIFAEERVVIGPWGTDDG